MNTSDKLSDFATIIKKANEDKRIREEQEKQRKLTEVAPLLDDFAAILSKATKEKKEKTQNASRIDEKAPRIDSKQESIPTQSEPLKIDPSPIKEVLEKDDTEPNFVIDDALLKKLDSKYLRLFNRLQSDFQTLKKTMNQTPVGFGGAGSGEVRILRMDDVDARNIQNNSVLVYDATLKKFVPVLTSELGTGTVQPTDEEMPYAKRVDFISDNELYKGEAPVGSPDGNPVWRIRKVLIGLDGDVTETWANGNAEYTNRWTDRLTLTYS